MKTYRALFASLAVMLLAAAALPVQAQRYDRYPAGRRAPVVVAHHPRPVYYGYPRPHRRPVVVVAPPHRHVVVVAPPRRTVVVTPRPYCAPRRYGYYR